MSNQNLLVKCESFQEAMLTLVRGYPILSVTRKGNILAIYNTPNDLDWISEHEILGDWYKVNFGMIHSMATSKETREEKSICQIFCFKSLYPFEFGKIYTLIYNTEYDFHVVDFSNNNTITDYFLIDYDINLLDYFIGIPEKVETEGDEIAQV